MPNQIYRRREFIIFRSRGCFIVQNVSKHFKQGHTHLRSFTQAKRAIDLCIAEKVPQNSSIYYLKSLLRLSKNKKYEDRLLELIEVRETKGRKERYLNQPYVM